MLGGIGLLMRMVVSDKAMLQERAVGALLNIGTHTKIRAHTLTHSLTHTNTNTLIHAYICAILIRAHR